MDSQFTRDIASKALTIETGKLAQQANGSVLLRYGDCVVLATATMGKPRDGIDFFPLTVDVEERLYARGKIPGSFFRREGRPSTYATLIARLVDRPIRPLFPKGFRNEVQVVVTPLSIDLDTPLDMLAIVGASSALCISDIPFEGPIGATRIGYVDGRFVSNPTFVQLAESALDLFVVGSRKGVVMMEAAANVMPDHLVLDAVELAQDLNQESIALQEDAIRSVGKPKIAGDIRAYPEELDARVATMLQGGVGAAFDASIGKAELGSKLKQLEAEALEELKDEYESREVRAAFDDLLEKEFSARILDGGRRPDGRGLKDIRPISCEVGLLPRTHGSGLFTRGETQILSIATLGSVGDAQKLDTLSPEESKRFMLHYNFPPYSVGEARRMTGPGRREIGHGALAERALSPVLPGEDEFPYTLRLVCEALSSNGSTSMGSVCAGTLALMDAGIPIKTPVAGISIGLITGDRDRYVTLTDIQGLEDHLGGMDFKVAGTDQGITAIQLDIKAKSIGFDVVKDAVAQAREARLFLLERMAETIGGARPEMSPYAPRLIRISIPVEKIGLVIGPGGKTIRGIVEETKATVDVMDDGTVIIGSTDEEASKRAVEMVKNLTREIEVGDIFTGKVVRITGFGAFVALTPGKDGLVHISELADYRVPQVEDVVSMGEEITVVVIDIDDQGRVRLSRRALLEGASDSGDRAGGGRPSGEQDRPAHAGRGPRSGERAPADSRERPGGYRSRTGPQGPRPAGRRGPPRSGPPRPYGPRPSR